MKPRLPHALRTALIACFATAIAPTLCTGAIGGGLVLLAITATPSAAAEVTWDGGDGTDNKWDTATNWSGDTVPGSDDTVTLGDGATISVAGENEITISGLKNSGSNELSGVRTLNITNGANNADLDITDRSTLTLSGGINVSVAEGAAVGIGTGGNLIVQEVSALNVASNLNVWGTLQLTGENTTATLGSIGAGSGTSGTVSIGDGATLTLKGDSSVGTLQWGSDGSIVVGEGSTFTVSNIQHAAQDIATSLSGGGTLKVTGNFGEGSYAKDNVTFTVTGTTLEATGTLIVGSGSAYTFKERAALSYTPSNGEVFNLWSRVSESKIGTLTLEGNSIGSIDASMKMMQQTVLTVTDSLFAVTGNLDIAPSNGGGANEATINVSGTYTGTDDSTQTATVDIGGNLNLTSGWTLHVTGGGMMSVDGTVDLTANSTLSVAAAMEAATLKWGNNGSVAVGEGSSFTVTTLQQTAESTNNLSGGGTLKVTGAFEAKDKVALNVAKTTLELNGTALIGSGSNYTFAEGAKLVVTPANHDDFTLWSWGSSLVGKLNFEGNSTGAINTNMVMKNQTALTVNGGSQFTVNGNLKLEASGGGTTEATINVGDAASAVTINGDLDMAAGCTLKVQGEGTVSITGGDDQKRSVTERKQNITIGEGATLREKAVRQTGQTTTISGIDGGGGTYEVASYAMSADAAASSILNINNGVTMHITGDVADNNGTTDSFILSNNWGTKHNVINIDNATLISHAAISNRGNNGDINVTNGGKLQMDGGLAYHGDNHTVAVNVDGRSTLSVTGTDHTGAEHLQVSLASGATLKMGEGGTAATMTHGEHFSVEQGGSLNVGAYTAGVTSTLSSGTNAMELDTLTVLAGDGTLRLEGSYTLDNAIVNNGTVQFADDIRINLDSLSYTGNLFERTYAIISGGTSNAGEIGWSNFFYGGQTLVGNVKSILTSMMGMSPDTYLYADGSITVSIDRQVWNAGGDSAAWNATDAAWNTVIGGTGPNAVYSNSLAVEFGKDDNTGVAHTVVVDAGGVTATGLLVSGDYTFTGGKVNVSNAFLDVVAGARLTLGNEGLQVGNISLSAAEDGGSISNLAISGNSLAVSYGESGGKANLSGIQLQLGADSASAVAVEGVQFSGQGNTIGGWLDFSMVAPGADARMSVADGAGLAVDGLTISLGTLSDSRMADGVSYNIIGGEGTLTQWDADHVSLVFGSSEVAKGVFSFGNGSVTANLSADNDAIETLYWDGLANGSASSIWDARSTNWSGTEGVDGDSPYKLYANVVFGKVPEGGSHEVSLSGMPVHHVTVSEGGYTFMGNEDWQISGNLTVNATDSTVFYSSSAVEVAGSAFLGNREDAVEGITTSVYFMGAIKAPNLYVRAAEGEAATGTYTFNGITGLDGGKLGRVEFLVDDQRVGGNYDATNRVRVMGELKATNIVVGGNAAKKFDGRITADTMSISAGGDDHNIVTFTGGASIGTLTLDEGAKLSLVNDGYSITNIEIGDALLRFETRDKHYEGYTIYSTHDNATLSAAGLTHNTITLLDGRKGDTGDYHDFTLYSKAREMTINKIADLKNLNIYDGLAVIGGDSTGAIHGDLTIGSQAVVRLETSNIMAEQSGAVKVDNSYLQLQGNEMKLYAGSGDYSSNSLSFDRAYVLGTPTSTSSDGTVTENAGLHLTLGTGQAAGTIQGSYRHSNEISSNLTIDSGVTLQLAGSAEAGLTLGGMLRGAGVIELTNADKAASPDAAVGNNTLVVSNGNNSFAGSVKVGDGSELLIAHQTALSGATVEIGTGGTLTLETGGKFPVTLQGLDLSGTSANIFIDSLTSTDAVNAQMAAIQAGTIGFTEGQALTLHFTFGEGVLMETMKTYNIFSSIADFRGPQVDLDIRYWDGSQYLTLDSNHYVSGCVQVDGQWVYYIRTRLGNIWSGNGGGDGIWSTTNTDKNWEQGTADYNITTGTALFVDLSDELELAEVTIQGLVSPEHIYFEAENTTYYLKGYSPAEGEDAKLAGKLNGDTVIHATGQGTVYLDLANNAEWKDAISGVNIHAGSIILEGHDLAFSDRIVIDPGDKIYLETGNRKVVASVYTAQGTFKGVTLGQDNTFDGNNNLQESKGYIAGSLTADGSVTGVLTNAVIEVTDLNKGYVELSNLLLNGDGGRLTNVTIGQNVTVAAGSTYRLDGTAIRLNDALRLETGTGDTANAKVILGAGTVFDIAGLTPQKDATTNVIVRNSDGIYGLQEKTGYLYTLLQGADGNDLPWEDLFTSSYMGMEGTPTTAIVMVNGVNLGTGLNKDVVLVTISQLGLQSDNVLQSKAGQLLISMEGADITQWDERWGAGAGPAVGRTNTGDALLYDNIAAEGSDGKAKYLYSTVLADGSTVADKDNIIVASISSDYGANGTLVGSNGGDKQIWIYNQGTGNFSELIVGSNTPGTTQSGSTHIMIAGGDAGANHSLTVGGSKGADQTAPSYVTLQPETTDTVLTRSTVVGASHSSTQSGSSHVFVDGGTVDLLVAGSYNGNLSNGKTPDEAAANLTITGGTLTTVYAGNYKDDAGTLASSLTGGVKASLEGGKITAFYGGSKGGTLEGGIDVTVSGADIDTLYAAGKDSTVTGNVLLNLESGSAKVVKAGDAVTLNGNLTVTLGADFELTNGAASDSLTGTILSGGKERGSGVSYGERSTSTLVLSTEDHAYNFVGDCNIAITDRTDNTPRTSIQGFDKVVLADGVTMTVHNGAFCNDTNVTLSTLEKGDKATVVFGVSGENDKQGTIGERTGSITLEEGITFQLGTSYAYNHYNQERNGYPDLYVKVGATFDVTNFPREQGPNDGSGCLSFKLHLAGDGVDGMGALYKGPGVSSTSPDGKTALAQIALDDNASIMAEGSNIISLGVQYKEGYLDLQQHTLTKIGGSTLRFYVSHEGELGGKQGGTIYVQEGTVDYMYASLAKEVDFVLGSEGTLSLSTHANDTALTARSLTGEGKVSLAANTKLTLESDYRTSQGVFYADWLGQGKYNNTNSGGYAYGVFSGTITSEDASAQMIKTGQGAQVLSGSSSTYSGSTTIQEGTLYLIGTSKGKMTAAGESAELTEGVLGSSSLVWESVNGSEPILKLGDGVQIFNDGYAVGGTQMTFEVAAAPQGTSALEFVVKDASGNLVTITVDGKTYYQMDATSLKSVNASGFYADANANGSKEYSVGDTIDRNRTLYLSADELGQKVGGSLSEATTAIDQTISNCEKIDTGKLAAAGLSSLDCDGYYGDGSAYKAGDAINTSEAKCGLYVTREGMSATAGQYLQYVQEPSSVYPDAQGDNMGNAYYQYNLTPPLTSMDLLSSSDPSREYARFYVDVLVDGGTTGVSHIEKEFLTYEELDALIKGEMEGKEFSSISAICYREDQTLPEVLQKALDAGFLTQQMDEASIETTDIHVEVACQEYTGDATSVAANGYYRDEYGTITDYKAGDEIDETKGTLYIPSASADQSVVVVTGLNPSGYEEATYSGVLADDGSNPSNFTKIGKGTLTIDQQSHYTGDTNLKEGTLNLKGWAQLQRETEGSTAGFNQSEGTSLKLSYDGTYKGEATELATDLVLVGSGDERWKYEDTTEYQTAALISGVGEKVSFTLSGDISGEGNVLHSGAGQLHISGDNTYYGGTTITEGVVYMESATALGDTAGDNMAAKVVVNKHTEDGKGGTLVITNGLGGKEGRQGDYVQFNSNRNAIEGTVIIGGYNAGSEHEGTWDTSATGSTLLMTGNGYWAEKTVIADNSLLAFNGAASSNKEMVGSDITRQAGVLVGGGDLAVSGAAGQGVTVRFDSINETNAEGADSFSGSMYVEGNNAKLEIGSGDYTVGADKMVSVSGYNATLEAFNTELTVATGGTVELSSFGNVGVSDQGAGAAELIAKSVTVEKGGTLATLNAATDYRYNLANLQNAAQVSTHETLIGNRAAADTPVYGEETKGKWLNVQSGVETLALPTALTYTNENGETVPYTYERTYTTNPGEYGEALNQNRVAVVQSENLTLKAGSTYQAAFANTSLGGHSLTLEAVAGDYNAANRVNLTLSLNGNEMVWDAAGRSTTQIVLFTDVTDVTFTYDGKTVNTDDAAYAGTEIFYMAAQDFFYDTKNNCYIDGQTLLVYDKGAQIVYLDRALPEPTTTTFSLLALTALLARRRRSAKA